MHPPASFGAPRVSAAPGDRPASDSLARRPPTRLLIQDTLLAAPLAEVFDFFSDAANLELITPDWMRFRIRTPLPIDLQAGTLIDSRIRLGPVPVNWRTRIDTWDPPRRFVDSQRLGPHRCWWHGHLFEPAGTATLMRDRVWFTPALGRFGQALAGSLVEQTLRRIFEHRAAVIHRRFGRPEPGSES